MEVVALVCAALLGAGAFSVGTMAFLELRDVVGFAYLRRASSIADAKRRRGRALVRGRVEVARGQVRAPLTGLECVYFRTLVWRLIPVPGGGAHYEDRGELRGGVFYRLCDESGSMLCAIRHDVEAPFTVDAGPLQRIPAEVEKRLRERGKDLSWAASGGVRVTEALITPGDMLTVIARTVTYGGQRITTVEHASTGSVDRLDWTVVGRAVGYSALTGALGVVVVALVLWALG